MENLCTQLVKYYNERRAACSVEEYYTICDKNRAIEILKIYNEKLEDLKKTHLKRKFFVKNIFIMKNNQIIDLLTALKRTPSRDINEFFMNENETSDLPFFTQSSRYDRFIEQLNIHMSQLASKKENRKIYDFDLVLDKRQKDLQENLIRILGTNSESVKKKIENHNNTLKNRNNDLLIINFKTKKPLGLNLDRCTGTYLLRYVLWKLYLRGIG